MFHKLSVWGGGERDYQVLQEFSSSVGVRVEPREIKECEDAWQFSPANFVKEIAHHSAGRDILVIVGEYDPPEFRRQSGEFEKSLRDSGVRTRYMDIPDTDHFSVIEKLQENSYSLTKECLRMMNLPRK